VSGTWADYDHVNVQRAIDTWLTDPAREHRLVGVRDFQHRSFGLAEPAGRFGPSPGNVARVNRPVGPDDVLACVRCGVYLVTEGDTRTALLVRDADPDSGTRAVTVQSVSTDPARAGQVASEVRALALEHNVFRHQVLSFGRRMFEYGQTRGTRSGCSRPVSTSSVVCCCAARPASARRTPCAS
jgi:hypothetical protein